MKSSISYHFSELYGNGIAYYQNIANYDYGKHLSDVQYLFKKMNQKIKGRNPSPQVSHYMNTYNDVPLWVLATDLTIGETSAIYRYLKGHCKTLVCNDFHNIGDKEYDVFEKKIFSLGKLFKGYAKVSVIYNNIGLKNAYKCSPFDFTLNEYKMLYDNQEAL